MDPNSNLDVWTFVVALASAILALLALVVTAWFGRRQIGLAEEQLTLARKEAEYRPVLAVSAMDLINPVEVGAVVDTVREQKKWLKRWIEVVELQLKARGIIRPGGSTVTVNNEGTIANMVKLLAQDAHEKGYLDFQEYLESDEDDEVIEAEVIEEGELENKSPSTFR